MEDTLRDIFKKDGENILDLQNWELYTEKIDHEKGKKSYYFIEKNSKNGRQISLGIFYKSHDLNNIEFIAWGYRDEKDCSFNAKVRDNKYIEDISAGCPCFEGEEEKESVFKSEYSPIYFFLSLSVFLAFIFSFGRNFGFMEFLMNYMAFFFLIFGILKVFSIKKFAKSFKEYDPVAKNFPHYSLLYPYLEVFLGLCFLSHKFVFSANLLTILILTPTTIAIMNKLYRKEKINCACLGGFFNVPVSKITVYENIVMIIMAFYMLN